MFPCHGRKPGGGGGGTHYVRVMGRLRGIGPPFFNWKKISILDPPFSRCLRKISILDPPPFFRILRNKSILDPIFAQTSTLDPPFSAPSTLESAAPGSLPITFTEGVPPLPRGVNPVLASFRRKLIYNVFYSLNCYTQYQLLRECISFPFSGLVILVVLVAITIMRRYNVPMYMFMLRSCIQPSLVAVLSILTRFR